MLLWYTESNNQSKGNRTLISNILKIKIQVSSVVKIK